MSNYNPYEPAKPIEEGCRAWFICDGKIEEPSIGAFSGTIVDVIEKADPDERRFDGVDYWLITSDIMPGYLVTAEKTLLRIDDEDPDQTVEITKQEMIRIRENLTEAVKR